MDIGDWPDACAAQQLTTDAKMAQVTFPGDALLSRQQRDSTLRWQEIMGT